MVVSEKIWNLNEPCEFSHSKFQFSEQFWSFLSKRVSAILNSGAKVISQKLIHHLVLLQRQTLSQRIWKKFQVVRIISDVNSLGSP